MRKTHTRGRGEGGGYPSPPPPTTTNRRRRRRRRRRHLSCFFRSTEHFDKKSKGKCTFFPLFFYSFLASRVVGKNDKNDKNDRDKNRQKKEL